MKKETRWKIYEYTAIQWIFENVSEMVLDLEYRKPYCRARDKCSILFRRYSDKEKYAVSEAIEYLCGMYEQLIKGYPKGNKSIQLYKERIEKYRRAQEKLLASIEEKKRENE